jgi:hypothetical protein
MPGSAAFHLGLDVAEIDGRIAIAFAFGHNDGDLHAVEILDRPRPALFRRSIDRNLSSY